MWEVLVGSFRYSGEVLFQTGSFPNIWEIPSLFVKIPLYLLFFYILDISSTVHTTLSNESLYDKDMGI